MRVASNGEASEVTRPIDDEPVWVAVRSVLICDARPGMCHTVAGLARGAAEIGVPPGPATPGRVRHYADQAVTSPTTPPISVFIHDEAINGKTNDGHHRDQRATVRR